MLLGNASRGKIIAKDVVRGPSGIRRLWMLRSHRPSPERAVVFDGIAMWASFAKEPVDVVFIDRNGRVLGICEQLKRWRAAGPFEGANVGIVLCAGTCSRVPIRAGDFLEFTPLTSERIAAGARVPESL